MDKKEEIKLSKNNHNYTQYSNKPKIEPIVTAEVKMDSIPETTPVVGFNAPKVEQETPKVEQPKPVFKPAPKPVVETVIGMVVGCSKLNVRAKADLFADIVCVLDNRSEIVIDVNKSNKEWFHVCTASGIEGYCMRKYVEAQL